MTKREKLQAIIDQNGACENTPFLCRNCPLYDLVCVAKEDVLAAAIERLNKLKEGS